ncbi:phenylpropionate dioxygenase-like ring-hydroxylating dioxygenase large terminal subunit [Streptacidiphilus sp. MAP12-16]|uniref:Rieske 2Fe-2S domain-containing protein n=1 Tax=Streptacidiphilus sp. MAP12-16 TaxID=3156300 RepID=UPI0035149696
MTTPAHQEPRAGARRGLTRREVDRPDSLLDWWHPVGWASDLTDAPRRTVLLGRPLVLWRDRTGTARCLRDLCVHRGTALSLGEVVDGQITCPYHGWRFAGDGRCTTIPQLPADRAVPAGAAVPAFHCEERYGMTWVCLGTPRAGIPAFPEWGAAGFRHAPCPPYTWRTSAARMVENFTDFGHLGWLHDGLLGLRSDLVVPEHRVERTGHELRYSLTMNVPSADGVNDLDSAAGTMTNTYLLSLPHTIHLRSHYPHSGRSRVLFFAAQPVDQDTSVGYCYQSRDFDLAGDDQRYISFQETLAEQDRIVVESQRPEQLPHDIADELHLKFDRVAVEYRKALAEHRPRGPRAPATSRRRAAQPPGCKED